VYLQFASLAVNANIIAIIVLATLQRLVSVSSEEVATAVSINLTDTRQRTNEAQG